LLSPEETQAKTEGLLQRDRLSDGKKHATSEVLTRKEGITEEGSKTEKRRGKIPVEKTMTKTATKN